MALAKDRIPHDLASKVQACVFNEAASGVNEYHKSVLEDEEGSQSTNGFSTDSAITHSPPLCGSGKGCAYRPEEAESLINFKASGHYNNLMHDSESFLSFQQSKEREYSIWENSLLHSPKSTMEPRLMQDFNCLQMASGYSAMANSGKEKHHGESSYGWLYSESNVTADSLQNSGEEEAVFNKRSSQGESMQAAKKQCNSTAATKKPKPKSNPSKDPQSIAAKNRRERISDRLKILQELVPNGSKVDLVTMLEKAISYVKFLQLQVKVLATDEFWPVQGGKAPDISQVKEAIDAILSSQKDRNSSSK
ncbi:hypothetical protein L6164_030801 [Bauhinia variegata]|uniref:Uncharacterized protein n=1 Tax=Bauhinia variegata TaxID=167791 RepID=A0ACB9LET3_BAUVA|nr:hypothetical protein L6164_030801 [Bauhinia variegata]